jgi:hypothetical protein
MTTKTSAKTERNCLEAAADGNILDAIHDNQTAAVDVARKWIDSIGEALPTLFEEPITPGAPAIHQITDAAFDLTRGILDAQRDFARRIVDSVVEEARKLD